MSPLEAGLRGGFVALMLLLAWRLLRGPQARAPWLGAAMALGAAAYAVQAPQAGLAAAGLLPAWQWPLQLLMNGNPVLVWLLARALFDDDFRLRPAHALLWLGWALLGLVYCTVWRQPLLGALAAAGPLLAVLASLWPLLRDWRDDLVEERRRLRVQLLALVLGYTAVSALAGIPSPQAAAHPWLGLADAAALLVLGLWLATQLLQLQAAAWWLTPSSDPMPRAAMQASSPSTPPTSAPTPVPVFTPVSTPGSASRQVVVPTEPSPPAVSGPALAASLPGATAPVTPAAVADPGALARLQRAMGEQQLFRREGLTIGALAVEIGLPEYRVRRTINQQLGHRNFNTFLNGHRIAWAQSVLADPQRADMPVLSIALEAGFQSLGPFNRAFKAVAGCTPTEYRARAWGTAG